MFCREWLSARFTASGPSMRLSLRKEQKKTVEETPKLQNGAKVYKAEETLEPLAGPNEAEEACRDLEESRLSMSEKKPQNRARFFCEVCPALIKSTSEVKLGKASSYKHCRGIQDSMNLQGLPSNAAEPLLRADDLGKPLADL